MLVLGGEAKSIEEARKRLERAVSSGEALSTMERMVAAQGGDVRVVADPSRLEVARESVVVAAERDGWIVGVDALEIGLAGVAMGAGRTRTDQAIDPAVGITVHAKPGSRVSRGDELARLHVRSREAATSVAERVRRAFTIADAPPSRRPLIRARLG
jgi:pyrimidine-nucleoside phosphorylase